MNGGPIEKEPKKKGRIQGANLLRNCKTRQVQMEYLLENMLDPDFSQIECKEVTKIDEEDKLNTAGITWRILNHQGFGSGQHNSDTPPSWGSVAQFMGNIQDYLPRKLRTNQNPRRLWSRLSFQPGATVAEDTEELLNDMCDWLEMIKMKIQDHIASRYFIDGKNQLLETLKRRYKSSWSERTEQSIDANIQDKTIDIKFEQL